MAERGHAGADDVRHASRLLPVAGGVRSEPEIPRPSDVGKRQANTLPLSSGISAAGTAATLARELVPVCCRRWAAPSVGLDDGVLAVHHVDIPASPAGVSIHPPVKSTLTLSFARLDRPGA